MIIGIALVVDELHKGPRLVFRYPASVPSNILNDNEDLIRFHNEYLNISPEHFAKLFRPKAALCNKVSELIVHDLHYVSYPSPCSEDSSSPVTSDSVDGDSICPISMFNVVVTSVRSSILRQMKYNGKYAFDGDHVSRESDPVATFLGLGFNVVDVESIRRVIETYSRALMTEQKRCKYVSEQVARIIRISETNRRIFNDHVMKSSSNMTSGNLLGGPDPSSSGMDIKPSLCDEHAVDADLAIMEDLSEEVMLANELRCVYHGLVGGTTVSLRVNDTIPLYLKLSLESADEQNASKLVKVSKQNHIELAVLFIAEADTIMSLLTKTNARLVEENLLTASGEVEDRVRSFVVHCTPFVSMLDLSLLMKLPIKDVLNLAFFFEKCGLASIIPVVHRGSVFKVHPTVSTDSTNQFFSAFANIFGHETIMREIVDDCVEIRRHPPQSALLFRVLSEINGVRNIAEVIEHFPNELKPFGVDIIVWLLRRRVITV